MSQITMTMKSAQAYTGLGRTTLHLAIKRGDLEIAKIGDRLLIFTASIDRWLEKHRQTGRNSKNSRVISEKLNLISIPDNQGLTVPTLLSTIATVDAGKQPRTIAVKKRPRIKGNAALNAQLRAMANGR